MTQEEKKHDPIIEFLLGSGELEGLWFGERDDNKRPFWWRSHLREYAERMSAISPAKQEQPDFEELGREYADFTKRDPAIINVSLKVGFAHGAKYVWETYVAPPSK